MGEMWRWEEDGQRGHTDTGIYTGGVAAPTCQPASYRGGREEARWGPLELEEAGPRVIERGLERCGAAPSLAWGRRALPLLVHLAGPVRLVHRRSKPWLGLAAAVCGRLCAHSWMPIERERARRLGAEGVAVFHLHAAVKKVG